MVLIKEYTKMQLRIIAANPQVDTNATGWERNQRPQNIHTFNANVYEIVQTHCGKLITLEQFKRIKVIPAPVVKVILSKIAV